MIFEESVDDWRDTNHKRVFYRTEGDEWNRGEFAIAKFVAEHIPGWTVVITMGPYRGHDIRHEIHAEEQLIHLDFYSAGMIAYGPDTPSRAERSVVEHAESLVHDIAQLVKDSDADFDLADS